MKIGLYMYKYNIGKLSNNCKFSKNCWGMSIYI